MCKTFVLVILATFIIGCGPGSNSQTQHSVSNEVGYFIDSAVSGVEYSCGNFGGITGSDGEFLYNENCKVIFKLGGIILGEIEGSSINEDNNVIPADIFGVSRDNITDSKIVFLIQFLQSLDEDNNPNNNIVIKKEIRDGLISSILNFTKDDISSLDVQRVISSLDKEFVSKDSALLHYTSVLKSKLKIVLDEYVEQENFYETQVQSQDTNKSESSEKLLSELTNILESSLDKNVSKVEVKLLSGLSTVEDTSTTIQSNNGFSYENQRVVDIEVKALPALFNKQILFFEELNILPSPVGVIEKLENKVLSTVFNQEGKLDLQYTLGNHITSLWLLVPFYGIKMEVPIVNNRIYITLNKGE